ncbi:MAG: chemotaxis protein CheD [Thermococcus sp.]|nr:chemotaxis protein CheD [Thermococcus sp.]
MILEEIKVGIGDYAVSKAKGVITTYGLGSCVGITLYDPVTKAGGMLHALLPEAKYYENKGNPAKYVDTGLELLLKDLAKLGAIKRRLEAKIFGGGHIFENVTNENLMIGKRNVETAKRELKRHKIKIVVEDTGGNGGRTISLNLETGKVKVRKVSNGKVLEKIV